ncbi:MAG: metalloregulator ArsR/SmtB family transcription factor [Bacillota bacterium]|nr:metalloregulator ArsR/SmtB family transcription factor [Bacillota bacterium]
MSALSEGENLGTIDEEQYIEVFQALSEKNRLNIIQLLSYGELCACKINENINITQPTLSHHMKVLCECGLVLAHKQGIWMHYRINKEKMSCLSEYFDDLANTKEGVNENLQGDCCR